MTHEETIADYDVRSPASRTLLTVIGTLLTVGLLAGLVLGASLLKRESRISTSVVELDGSAQVVINAGSADVTLVEGEEDLVKIRARITSGLRKTDFALGRRGDEIKIASGCQTWLSPGCGVSATLEIPKGMPVVVRTTSGDVVADGLTEGVLTVTSDSGDIVASKLEVDEFSAATGDGDIRASFSTQPFGFKATTVAGDIWATVPTGKRTYVVTTSSKSGKVSNALQSDAEGAGFVRVRSDSGDIDLGSE
ncbi:hypothetical protein C6I20_03785 [Aeromicrobium sp. A1-2]|uniref:DUF4097 family beta strand repeat-containing protein n=1 Tax=Aeromicrobium sp. A1-2 TaxID=2107713 RepID=UPI000E4B4DA2|nr:DUF4097 family beta strand repeat-containing protein [Aeromicrobium sp. A1-2]AXT84402.1 hypothetical protein C6I20_03785 [Aeromicrobium sp. A1-2]